MVEYSVIWWLLLFTDKMTSVLQHCVLVVGGGFTYIHIYWLSDLWLSILGGVWMHCILFSQLFGTMGVACGFCCQVLNVVNSHVMEGNQDSRRSFKVGGIPWFKWCKV